MSAVAKRKPCPFCQSSDSFVEAYSYGLFYVACNECGARGPDMEAQDVGYDDQDKNKRGERAATRGWNTRNARNRIRKAAT